MRCLAGLPGAPWPRLLTILAFTLLGLLLLPESLGSSSLEILFVPVSKEPAVWS